MNISETVKAAMTDKGITRSDLAKQTGYSYQYIYDLLAGQRRWHEEPINRVFKALGIQVSFDLVEQPTPCNAEESVMVKDTSEGGSE